MISKKFLDLPNLSETEAFYIHELFEIIIVGKIKNLMLISF